MGWGVVVEGSGFLGRAGFSGFSGFSRFSGVSGFSGDSGVSGSSGFSGASGSITLYIPLYTLPRLLGGKGCVCFLRSGSRWG